MNHSAAFMVFFAPGPTLQKGTGGDHYVWNTAMLGDYVAN